MSPQEVRQARRELGLSRSQLAAILDTDTREIRRLEADERAAPRSLLTAALGWLVLVSSSQHLPSNWSTG